MKCEESQASAIEILRISRPKLRKLTKISTRFAKMGTRWLRLVLSVAEVMTSNLHVSLVRQQFNPSKDVGNAKPTGEGAESRRSKMNQLSGYVDNKSPLPWGLTIYPHHWAVGLSEQDGHEDRRNEPTASNKVESRLTSCPYASARRVGT